jgi:hypothetical protein
MREKSVNQLETKYVDRGGVKHIMICEKIFGMRSENKQPAGVIASGLSEKQRIGKWQVWVSSELPRSIITQDIFNKIVRVQRLISWLRPI